jgi:[ribosomal protein S5]-alanine N-acetyltransferase
VTSTDGLPPWPAPRPECDGVRLSPFRHVDLPMVPDLATDSSVAAISTLPAGADADAARAWIERQHARWRQGAGFSFAVADVLTDRALTLPGLDRLEMFVEPGNTASVRTAERAGYRREEAVLHPRRPGTEPIGMLRFALERPQTS